MHAMNQKSQKAYNRSLILYSLFQEPKLSRADLATRLNLKKSSITPIVADLLELNIIQEIGLGEQRKEGGRKPILLTLADSFGVVVGINLQPHIAYVVVATINGAVLHKEERLFNAKERKLSLVEKFAGISRAILEEATKQGVRVLGFSLGIPGWIQCKDGVILHSIPFHLRDYPFQEAIQQLNLPVPVLVENDANCGAWSEVHKQGDHESSIRDFLFLLFVKQPIGSDNSLTLGGAALGLGVAINGEVYVGENFSAGDFTSAFWSSQKGGEEIQIGTVDAQQYNLLSNSNKQEDIAASRTYVAEILQNLIPLTTVLAPEKIIVAGEGCGQLDLFKSVIHTELAQSYFAENQRDALFEETPYGVFAPAFGAVKRFLWELFYPVVPQGKEPYYYRELQSLFNN